MKGRDAGRDLQDRTEDIPKTAKGITGIQINIIEDIHHIEAHIGIHINVPGVLLESQKMKQNKDHDLHIKNSQKVNLQAKTLDVEIHIMTKVHLLLLMIQNIRMVAEVRMLGFMSILLALILVTIKLSVIWGMEHLEERSNAKAAGIISIMQSKSLGL